MPEQPAVQKPEMVSKQILPASLAEMDATKNPLAMLANPTPVITPFIPSGLPQNAEVNKQLQGDVDTGPNPGAHVANLKNGTLDYVKAVKTQMGDQSWATDRYKYSRQYSYGAGYKNLNFDRYYNHPKFRQLGFSPWRDNESYYNQKSSWFDDFSRMMSQFIPLQWSGMKSVWGSSIDANEEMERRQSIGSTSKGGFGGWITNFGLNSAYTTGIMGELAVENAAMALAAPFTGGASEGVEAGRDALAFGKIAKAIGGTADALSALKDANKAKSFWEMTRGARAFLNPLEHTWEYGKDLVKGTGSLKELSGLARTARGFGAFYKDIREINLAWSEAKLEGQSGAVKRHQELIDQYYAKHGEMPQGKDAELIWQKTQASKTAITMVNTPMILLSNKLVFDGLFKGFGQEGKAIEKAALEESGRDIKNVAAKDFKAGEDIVSVTPRTGLQKAVNALFRSEFSPISKAYLLGNLSEALQENTQDVIQSAVKNYYDTVDSHPSQAGFATAMAMIGRGTAEQFSAQGLDTFMSGLLMGSLVQGGTEMIKGTWSYGQSKITGKPTARAQRISRLETNNNDIINAANSIGRNSQVFSDKNAENLAAVGVAQEGQQVAEDNGDTKTGKDLSKQAEMQHFYTLASTNQMGLVTEHVDDMLSLDDKSLAEAYNQTEDKAGDIRKKLTDLKDRATEYQIKYNNAQESMPNPHNPWVFDKEKNPEDFKRVMNKYVAHNMMVQSILDSTELYQDAANRMKKIGDNLSGRGNMFRNLINVFKGGTPVANAAASDISLLVDHSQRATTIIDLAEQIKIMKEGTPEQKRQARDLQVQHDLLKQWNDVADNYYREYGREQKLEFSPKIKAARQHEARFQPGAVVKHKTTGKQYTIAENLQNGKAKTKDGKIISTSTHEVVKDASGKSSEFNAVRGDELSAAAARMYDVYGKYLRHVAGMQKGHIFNKHLDEAFRQLKDYYALGHDLQSMVQTINTLNDPLYRQRYLDMLARVAEGRERDKIKNLQIALDKYRAMANHNNFLNALFDLGVFVLPDDIDKLENFEMVDFYSAPDKATVSGATPVAKDSELYKKIVEVVKEYAAKAGKDVTELPIVKKEEVAAEQQLEKPAESVKPESTVITIETPLEQIRALNPEFFASLMSAYKTWASENDKKVPEDENLIQDSQGYKSFLTSGSAADLFSQLGKPPVKPIVEKKKAPDTKRWIPGKKWLFTGKTGAGENLTAQPVEVIEDFGKDYDTDTKKDIHEIQLKNLVTGANFTIDLYSPEALTFKVKPVPGEKVVIPETIISDEAFKEFTNSGWINPGIQKAIAAKIVKGEPLSARESAVYSDYPGEIENFIKAEKPVEKPVSYPDLMGEYANITSKTELEAWSNMTLQALGNPAWTDALTAQNGVEFNQDYVRRAVEDKRNGLMMNLDIDTLTPGTAVIMKDGKTIRVVKNNTGKGVVLVSLEAYEANDPTAGTITIPNSEIKNQIQMKYSDVVDQAEQTPAPTQEEKESSDEAVANAKDVDPDFDANAAVTAKPEDIDKEFDGFDENSCSVKPK